MRVRTIVPLALAVALSVQLPRAASAGVTAYVGAGAFAGAHANAAATVAARQVPLPIGDLVAGGRRVEIALGGLPYALTRHYGNPFDPFQTEVGAGSAVVRVYDRRGRFALGAGYGAFYNVTNRPFPATNVNSFADGLRLELRSRLVLPGGSRVEFGIGALPSANAYATTTTGIAGAAPIFDRQSASEFDALAAVEGRLRGRLRYRYGVRYLNERVAFRSSGAFAESNAGILPFAEVGLHFGR